LIISDQGRELLKQELGLDLIGVENRNDYFCDFMGFESGCLYLLNNNSWQSVVASGSGAPDKMVIAPCSMATLAKVAAGIADNLIARAADVVLKERGKLILVPRETPLSTVHLENMLRISRAGGVILPPTAGFYNDPETIEDMVDFVIARIFKQLGLNNDFCGIWGEE
ncbi:MAG: UbiX family flavin prenyltransferase, partial [Gammaproteobacteria bacterium]